MPNYLSLMHPGKHSDDQEEMLLADFSSFAVSIGDNMNPDIPAGISHSLIAPLPHALRTHMSLRPNSYHTCQYFGAISNFAGTC